VTAAGKFAEEAEALGWTVERLRNGSQRTVVAHRGHEEYRLVWYLSDRGNVVFRSGEHFTLTEDFGAVCEGTVVNVKAVLREMAKHPNPNGGSRLPYDPVADDDYIIAAALAGRAIEWTNSISGLTEKGIVPRGGNHLQMVIYGGDRCVHFADGHGFHTVRVSAITKVSDEEVEDRPRLPRAHRANGTGKKGKR
jgi:hypothetical protein